MKLRSITGGQASRVEVYGLFIAATVLLGGGIGGAYAITTSLNTNDDTVMSDVVGSETSSPSSTPVTTENSTPENAASDVGTDAGDSAKNPSSPVQAPDQPPVSAAPDQSPPVYVDTRIQEPYIGPGNTFSYLSSNHICGWDIQALGGFGWGYDPASPCNEKFVAYIGQHCEANDGVVFAQRCEEYFSHTLPVAY